MIVYQKQYIQVKSKDFPFRACCILQLCEPQLIGIIRTFRNHAKDESDRRKYLASANLDLTGKANRYRVFCHPYGSTQKLGNRVSPDEMRRIMAEMADFYISQLEEDRREELKDK